MKTKHSKGTWKVGKDPNVVVTDNGYGFPTNTGHDDAGYYGGFLIAESIWKVEDAKLIAAAPELLQACISAMQDTIMLLNETAEFTPENLESTIEVLSNAIKKATE